MSRIGIKPINVPQQVKVAINGRTVLVEGPKGKLSYDLPDGISVKSEGALLSVDRESEAKKFKAFHGLARVLINNMIIGVTDGFSKELEIVGVGFRAQVQGKKLTMQLGFSHPVEYPFPDGITIESPGPTNVIVKGIDKQKVGQTAAEIRNFYRPEPYKGKGIKYKDEVIRRKVGKKVA